MFSYIKGKLEVKTTGYVVIDINGLGYKIFMSDTAINKIGDIGEVVKVHTYVKVREDDISIYGFNTNEELRMFELLLSVSGIGAKSAITILSNISPSSFAFTGISNSSRPLICAQPVRPGLTSLAWYLSLSAIRSFWFHNAGLGPITAISPFNILIICGNSSKEVFLRNLPDFVMYWSGFDNICVGISFGVSTYIVLNL